jgi:glycosyltransferase involved in cell wall biosynthesis
MDNTIRVIEGVPVEIIVVNDGDNELEVKPSVQGKIRFINNHGRGVSAARNTGALQARGEILLFIDDDMWINPEIIGWIHDHMIQKKETSAVYNINWEYPPHLNEKLKTSKIGKFILSSGYNTMWGRMHEDGKSPLSGTYKFNAIASCSLVLSKELFNRIGGYNESILFQGEDIDLAIRIRRLSIPVFCVFDVTLYHNHEDRLDLSSFLDRMNKGYRSQFMAEKAGVIPVSANDYKRPRAYIFDLFLSSEKIWTRLYHLLPNNTFFEPLVNRLIGILSGLEKYRQWKNAYAKSKP